MVSEERRGTSRRPFPSNTTRPSNNALGTSRNTNVSDPSSTDVAEDSASTSTVTGPPEMIHDEECVDSNNESAK